VPPPAQGSPGVQGVGLTAVFAVFVHTLFTQVRLFPQGRPLRQRSPSPPGVFVGFARIALDKVARKPNAA
jgi:hypothetical protein